MMTTQTTCVDPPAAEQGGNNFNCFEDFRTENGKTRPASGLDCFICSKLANSVGRVNCSFEIERGWCHLCGRCPMMIHNSFNEPTWRERDRERERERERAREMERDSEGGRERERQWGLERILECVYVRH